jgi:hypothetical protein
MAARAGDIKRSPELRNPVLFGRSEARDDFSFLDAIGPGAGVRHRFHHRRAPGRRDELFR